MAKFKKYENVVLNILKSFPLARSDDYFLMSKVCEQLNPDVCSKPFKQVMQQHKTLGVPNWETVSRCRRKVQEKHPELKNPETAQIRAIEQEDYKGYAHT